MKKRLKTEKGQAGKREKAQPRSAAATPKDKGLQESEAKFSSLVENTAAPIGITNLTGDFTYVNKALANLTGYTVQEMVGRPFTDFLHPEDREAVLKVFMKGVSTPEGALEIEFRVKHRDGQILTLTSKPTRLEINGKTVGFQAIITDITKRKQIEEQMKTLSSIVEQSTNSITIVDEEGVVEYANPAFLERNSFRPDQVIGKNWRVFLSADSTLREKYPEIRKTVMEKRALWRGEVADHTQTGRPVWVDARLFPIKDASGRVIHTVYISEDITERKLAEEKLRLQGEIAQNMFEGVVLIRASDGVIVYTNPRFEQMFGYASGELIGKNITIVNAPVEGKSPEDVAREIIVSLNQCGAWSGEVRNIKKDGTPFWCRANVSTLETSEHGTVWVTTHEDITERVMAKAQVDQQRAVMDATNRVFKGALTCETEEELGRTCLNVAEALTSSRFGFIGEVNPAGHLDPIAISNPGWDACKMPQSEATLRIRNMELRGIWARVLKDERSLIVNDPATHPDRVGPPKGHPPLTSFLGTPLKQAGKTYGMIALANKESGYDVDDQKALELLSVAITEALSRRRAEDAQRRRAGELAALQATVLDITGRDDLPELLNAIVERAAHLLEASSGGMYLCDPEKREARCVVSYNTPHDHRGVVLRYGEGAAGRVAETGKPLIVDDYRLWEGRAAVYEKDKPFTALLSAPMMWQGRVTGVIHVLEESKVRRFTQADLELLTLFANHAAIAVERTRTEETLAASEEAFRGITERSFDAILTVDLEGRITYASPAVERITGYNPSEVVGASFMKFLPESETTKGVRILSEAFRGNVVTSVEANILKKDGSIVCLEFAGSPVLKHGKLTGFQGIARDITDRKRLEKELRESERRFTDVADNAREWVWEVDPEGRYVYTSPVVEAILGYKREEVLGRHFYDFFHPEDREGLKKAAFGIVAAKGSFHEFLNRNVAKDGRVVWLSTSGVPRFDKDGNLLRYRGADIDVTERKRMEEELRQHSEHLEQLVEVRTRKLRQTEQDLRSTKERLEYLLASNPAAIYSAKPLADGSDFHMTYVSEAVASILGFEPREFIGHPEFWDDLIHPEDRRSVFAEVPVLWKEGQHMFEYRLRHRDGNYRWIREESRLVRDADGKPIEVNGYWIDVTELKRMEEELRHAQRMATIGELAAMVGHDLRNPLTGISGAAYYLKESLPPTVDDRAKEMLTVIEQAVEYADGIMNDLVQYSGEMRLTMTGAGPRSIVEQALGLVGVPEDVRVSNLTSDETKIMVDAARMKRAFVNLIKNAVDAMPEGGELTITSSKSDGNLQIVVSDTGTGIKQEGIARIGTPFYTTKAKGMGLGLSICKRIVEAHGGSLTVESKDGGGTKVTVTVPINAGRREVKAND